LLDETRSIFRVLIVNLGVFVYSEPNGTVCKAIGVEKNLVKEHLTTNPKEPSPLKEAQGDVAQRGVNSFIILVLL
jgi:hypothetical protein